MAEVVNLRRVRKAKARAETSAKANANRIKHGTSKLERNLESAGAEKSVRTFRGLKLDTKD